jgi:hypothetical protein
MNKINQKRGFAPLLVLLIIVLIGGGSYYAVKKSHSKAKVETKIEATSTTPEETADESGNISLKALFSLNKDTKCTFTNSADSMTSSGTVYISGSMMRGDFNSNTTASGSVDSHMIRSQDDIYVWSGANGSKMGMDAMMNAKPTTAPKSGANFDFDQKLDYHCSDWKKDASLFVVPTSVHFIDLKAMMQGKLNVTAH